ncbi:MAG: type II toxin-antitoxin system VapC family toxin [bacterium]|nr:type II toxin-antitoxin system VapC family toxin [bacterium]
MPTSNSVLFDTNILVYSFDDKSPYHDVAVSWRNKIVDGKINGVLSSQNLAEFSRVLLDSKQSNLVLPRKIIAAEIANYRNEQGGFTIIYPNNKSLDIFEKLILTFKAGTKSVKIFDIFLVATMLGNNIKTILTANVDDFKEFQDKIKIISLSS